MTMTYLMQSATYLIQTALMMLGAFLLGLILGKLIKRLFCRRKAEAPSAEVDYHTAEFNAAKKLSPTGTTEPKYFLISSGCSRTASEMEQNIMPTSASLSL